MSRVNYSLRIPARCKSAIRSVLHYQHSSRDAALASVELIMLRGNAVKMSNVGSKFFVTELVVS